MRALVQKMCNEFANTRHFAELANSYCHLFLISPGTLVYIICNCSYKLYKSCQNYSLNVYEVNDVTWLTNHSELTLLLQKLLIMRLLYEFFMKCKLREMRCDMQPHRIPIPNYFVLQCPGFQEKQGTRL